MNQPSQLDPSTRDHQDGPDRSSTSRLLALARSEPRRPVDRLIERLEAPDGPAWFASSLTAQPLAMLGNVERLLVGGEATLDQVRELKEAGKAQLLSTEAIAKLRGMLVYFIAVAAGLALHQRLICSRGREEVDSVLLDLATVLPPRWADLMCVAAETETTSNDS